MRDISPTSNIAMTIGGQRGRKMTNGMTPPRLPSKRPHESLGHAPCRWLRAAPEPPIQRRSRRPRNAQLEESAARHVTVILNHALVDRVLLSTIRCPKHNSRRERTTQWRLKPLQ